MKNKKCLSLILLGVLVVGCLTGCGANSISENAMSDSAMGMSNTKATMWNISDSIGSITYNDSESYETTYEEPMMTVTEESSTENGVETRIKDEAIIQQEKLVYTARVSMETKEYLDAMNYLHTKITENNGIIENEEQKNLNYDTTYDYSSSYILVRIPQQNYEKFLSEISGNDKLISLVDISRTVDNFTTMYSDLEVEIESLEVMQERLFNYLRSASSIEEMLDIEERIADTQARLNKLVNSRNKIDRDVAYSTVHINLREVREYTDVPKPKDNFFVRLKGYFVDSGKHFLRSAESFIEWFIMAFPTLVIWGLIIFFIVKFIKKRRLKKGLKPKKLKVLKEDNIENVDEIIEESKENKE